MVTSNNEIVQWKENNEQDRSSDGGGREYQWPALMPNTHMQARNSIPTAPVTPAMAMLGDLPLGRDVVENWRTCGAQPANDTRARVRCMAILAGVVDGLVCAHELRFR